MKYEKFHNKHFDKPWHIWDDWTLVVGLGEKWFGLENWYYDGHTFNGFTLFHIVFAKAYSYQSEELTND
jgi:hypothetical protein